MSEANGYIRIFDGQNIYYIYSLRLLKSLGIYYMDMKHSDAIVYYGYSWETKVENEGENPKKFHRNGNEKISPESRKIKNDASVRCALLA